MLPKGDNRRRSGKQPALQPARKSRDRARFYESNPMLNIVLYSRDGCHLCEEAQEVLSNFGISPTIIDIDADENLRARFGTCVPVVEIDGQIRFRGQVDPKLLQRIIRSSN
jgi:glutaredoxin